jgi:phosphate uptake regulator
MKRKIIKQGLGGYTIYLPKEWIDKKGLKAGKEVDIIESDTDLIIRSQVVQKKSANINLTDNNQNDIKVIITHLYRNGVDKIQLNNITKELLTEIKEDTNQFLLGFEITEQSANKCIIENISEPSEEKFEALLRRIFLIIRETQNILVTDFNENKFKHLKEIEEQNHQIDKYILFCRRIVVKEKYKTNPLIMWELLTFLMHIQHAHYYLYKYSSENKLKQDKNILKLLAELEKYFTLYYDSYFKKDISYVHEINNLKKKYQFGECIKSLESSSGKNTVVYSYLREIFRIIQIGASPILSELIEKEIN